MKISFTKKATEFLEKHSVAISDGVKSFIALVGGIGSMAIGAMILKMNGIDISLDGTAVPTPASEPKKPATIDYNELAETAIEKTRERGLSAFYDSEKELAAKDIRDIAMRDGVTTAKTTAIHALSEISNDVFYDTTRSKIGAYIKEIALSL